MSDEKIWKFFLSPPAAWDAMYADCKAATKSIELEQYIFENDSVGQRFMALFTTKASEGVKVSLIIDGWGSQSYYNSSAVGLLQAKGGQVYFYNHERPIDFICPWRWFPRTHVKTLLVDKDIAYTGGVCFAERMTGWRDTQIRLRGVITEGMSEDFERVEELVKQKKLVPSNHHPKYPKAPFVYMESYPVVSWHLIYLTLSKAIYRAEKYIYISSPFFAPNRRFRLLLQHAAEKGVEVRLIVPEHSDVAAADWLCLSYVPYLLKKGARIFLYQGSVLHQKTVVIDDRWATIGSTNMDVLSFFRNRESNLVIEDRDTIAALKDQFLNDLKNCTELTKELLAMEPWWKIAVGYLCRLPKTLLWRT